MKAKFIVLSLLALTCRAFSQSKNTMSAVYGTTANSVNIHHVIGDFGYQNKSGWQAGVNYSYQLNHTIALQTGIMFTSDDVELSSITTGHRVTWDGNIKLLSVPLITQVTFLKYLFVDGGILADVETNYSSDGADPANKTATRQTGIGFELGLGAKGTIGRVNLFVNPYFQNHAVIRVTNASSFNLIDTGFKFGAGYRF